jgi:hypothetical protein
MRTVFAFKAPSGNVVLNEERTGTPGEREVKVRLVAQSRPSGQTRVNEFPVKGDVVHVNGIDQLCEVIA